MLEGSYVGLGCCQDAGLETRMQHPSRASASRMLELGAEKKTKNQLSCPQGPLNFSKMTSGKNDLGQKPQIGIIVAA